jgi:hypothetical protein
MNPFRALASALVLAAAMPAVAQTVLQDDFGNPASGWPHVDATRDSDAGFSIYTDSGQYQLTPVKDNTFGLVPAPRQARGDNVRIETDMFMYAGLGAGVGGVACRAQDMENFYGFIARGDAVLMIVKVKDGQPTPLAQGRVKSVMAGSVDTRFTVECKGDTLSLAATGGSRIEATDSELRGGRSGLLVAGEKMAGTSAVFDNFVLVDLGGGNAPASTPHASGSTPAATGAASGARPTDASSGADDGAPARVRDLRQGQALVVVEHDGFRGEGLIEFDARGELRLAGQWNEGGPQGMNLYFNHSGDSFYTTLRTGDERSSAIATWNVEIDESNGRGSCARMDLYTGKPGTLSVWNADGKRVCVGA